MLNKFSRTDLIIVAIAILALLVAISIAFSIRNSGSHYGHPVLGTPAYIHVPMKSGASLANANIYAYRYGKYCGKGTYSSVGDKYNFGCNVSVRLLAKRTAPNPTPAPYPTPQPQPTQPTGTCTDDTSCGNMVLAALNTERASHHIAPLTIDWSMSLGTGTCIGAKGHSLHMASTGVMAHDQFPADVCGSYSTAGENIGYGYGDQMSAFQSINQQMLAESWTPGCSGNHHCNIDSSSYSKVGVGFAQGANGTTWLTEDFSN